MFEHMKNYQKLMRKISGWLKPGGKLFVHIFTHATTPYHFKDGCVCVCMCLCVCVCVCVCVCADLWF
jgi:hypothetical protein